MIGVPAFTHQEVDDNKQYAKPAHWVRWFSIANCEITRRYGKFSTHICLGIHEERWGIHPWKVRWTMGRQTNVMLKRNILKKKKLVCVGSHVNFQGCSVKFAMCGWCGYGSSLFTLQVWRLILDLINLDLWVCWQTIFFDVCCMHSNPHIWDCSAIEHSIPLCTMPPEFG